MKARSMILVASLITCCLCGCSTNHFVVQPVEQTYDIQKGTAFKGVILLDQTTGDTWTLFNDGTFPAWQKMKKVGEDIPWKQPYRDTAEPTNPPYSSPAAAGSKR